jgi:hypothetical protein
MLGLSERIKNKIVGRRRTACLLRQFGALRGVTDRHCWPKLRVSLSASAVVRCTLFREDCCGTPVCQLTALIPVQTKLTGCSDAKGVA